ncbi:hypothetical protein [Bordetella sp. LUAb4]|uniref:hypothetical protein n=1 Tax=Bordetella sp. LUAb4 TaxID=2843195 RepID=UPI001E41F57F|nr:hypothetical protein [Bordetella sp. LUAb4]
MTEPLQVEGRLPAVFRNAQLLTLRSLAARMNCNIADMLVALFCMVTRGVVAFATNDAADALAAQSPDGFLATTQVVASYLLRVPGGLTQTHPGGAIAFLYSRTSVGRAAAADGVNSSPAQGEQCLVQPELIAQVTEFDQHLLVEYVFDPHQLDRGTVARLLFEYSQALERLMRGPAL